MFLDAFYRYYTDFEPGSAWVAVAGEEVVGFLTGCLDTNRQQAVLRNKLAPDLLWGVLNRRYRLGKMGWRYVRRLALGMIRDEFPYVDLREYPAHLHINVDRGWRVLGLGKSLMAAYLRQLRQSEFPVCTSLPAARIQLLACSTRGGGFTWSILAPPGCGRGWFQKA